MQSPEFHGHGLHIHIRTTIVEDKYSFIEASAVRLGQTTIEFHYDTLVLDNVEYDNQSLPLLFESGGHEYSIVDASTDSHRLIKVILDDGASISVRSTKHFMTVNLEGSALHFGTSQGLLGDYHTGELLGRNSQLITDTNDFGMEWQVLPGEALFSESRSPQLPYERCRMPSTSFTKFSRRKLRSAEETELFNKATEACNGVLDLDLCIQDVMATGEVAMADMFV